MSQALAYKAIRTICISLGLIAALAMALVTVIVERTDATTGMWLAMPGLMCHLLITGGHGGTHVEEVAGFAVAICVNALLGALPFALAIAIFKRLRNESSLPN